MFLWRSTSCTTKFSEKNTNKKENITVQKPGNVSCLIHGEDSSATLSTAVSTSYLAFTCLLFLYSILSSEGLCQSWPLLYKDLWFQKSPEMLRKQDCRWCALCTVYRLYQNGLEFQGDTVPCTCTNATAFMPVHEKYDLPYNNFHGSHKWSRGAKVDNVQYAASHIQQSVSQSHPHYYKHSNSHQVTAIQLRQETAHSSNNTNVCQRPVPRSPEGRPIMALAISLP